MHTLFAILKNLAGQLKKENLHKVALATLILIILGGLAFYYFEDKSLLDSFWWAFVTMTTVGYGDFFPVTLGGRIAGIFLMMIGIGFLGLFTAIIAGIFLENKILESKGMKETDVEGHFVICGWNYKGYDIVAELKADLKCGDIPIVLISDLDEKPDDLDDVEFIHGEVNAAILEKANVGKANSIMVLGDDSLEPHVRDAKTILNTLAIKSAFPDIYVSVELAEPKNVEHCKLAKADEIIVGGALTANLLVQAFLDHGITKVVTELISNQYGNELYLIDLPEKYIGMVFADILDKLKREKGVLCLGIDNAGELITNPDADYAIKENDRLVAIATARPDLASLNP